VEEKVKAQVPKLALGIREFSQRMSVSDDHTRRQLAAGKLKGVHFGKRILIPISEVDRILAGASDEQ